MMLIEGNVLLFFCTLFLTRFFLVAVAFAGTAEVRSTAVEWAQKWISAVYTGYGQHGYFFEKVSLACVIVKSCRPLGVFYIQNLHKQHLS